MMKRFVVGCLLSALAASGVACSDRTAPDPVVSVEPAGVVVSSAVENNVVSSNPGEVAYVSIAPQTYPGAVSFEIGNRAGGATQTFAAVDGGLDPVAIPAHAGDVLNITVRTTTNAPTTIALNVPVRRPPVVVRTNPAKGRVDVALNVNVSVVFSEPIDGKSLDTAALQLRHDGVPSAGSLRLSQDALTAEFTPDGSLLPLATYELLVTQRVRGVDGQALPAPYSSTFTTCPYYAVPTNCPPFPTGGTSVISGTVFERTASGTTPLANASVWAWVQYPNGSGYSRGLTVSDASGHYSFDGVPNAFIIVEGGKDGYNQPCASYLQLDGPSATANVELVSQGHPLIESATTAPAVFGVVYEMTASGRKPVAGATTYFDAMGGLDLIAATSTTDENGRYAMCNLPAIVPVPSVEAGKAGYDGGYASVLLGPSPQQVDIELKPKQ